MKKISCLIVDDEHSCRAALKNHLERHCPDIEVMGEASSADEAKEHIARGEPQLVFLDINMPGKSGFDLLRMFSEIDFQVIFVSGFDEYAIQAFDFNAIDYILKPVDHAKLVSAVSRARERIALKDLQSQNILHFVHSIDEKNELLKKIFMHQNGKVSVLEISDIACIEAARGYCEIYAADGQKYISAKPLKDYETLLAGFSYFIRANKSSMLNVEHIKSYSKGTSCFITLANDKVIEVSRRKKTEILDRIKGIGE